MGMNIGRGTDIRHGTSNQDVLQVNREVAKSDDSHVEQMRQKIGSEFTADKKRDVGKKKNEMGKDDFMKLMSAQLKYQDPINPMKNEQMAAQLAQFSALEQMMNVNSTLEKMVQGQKPSEHMMAATLIGKRIQTDSTHFMLEKGASPEIKFNLPEDAATVSLSVVDQKGEVVREYDLGELQRGEQSVRWDGKNGKFQDQPVGEYSYRLSAADREGKGIPIKTDSTGIVSGVTFEAGKSILIVDGKKVPIEKVRQIEADTQAEGKAAVATAAKEPLPDEAPAAAQAAKKPAAAGAAQQPVSTAKKSAQSSKQNPSSSAEQANTTQVAKNSLPPDLSPEKIKNLMASMGGVPTEGEIENESGPIAEKTIDPLWNPATN